MATDTVDLGIEAVLDAWRRWDDLPADRNRAVEMELACLPLATRSGVSVTGFRRRLASACVRRRQAALVIDRRACVEEALR